MSINLEKIFKACGFQKVDENLAKDLNKIINWQEQLQTINIDNVKPMLTTIGDDVMYISNKDESIKTNCNILSNSPENYDNFFLVPKVIKN